jgi:putative ABC transport system permease protein
MRKIARRELRHTPGRFIALFLIVFLGAGFLAGLQSSAPGMEKTADAYFTEKKLTDFWLSCNLGITADDVAAAAALPDVAQVSGGYRVDLKATISDIASLFAIYSLPTDAQNEDYISQPRLMSGRLPENSKECIADSFSFIQLGDTITVTEDNREDSLEIFTPRTLTVVGLARTPRYVSTTRGNTNIGNGQVSNFLYVPEEAFTSEYYTELNLRLTSTEGVSAFSEEYKTAIETARTTLEEFTQQRAKLRHSEISEEAQISLDEAEAEYETESARVESELTSAQSELEEGRTALDKALKDYEEYTASLTKGREELERGKTRLAASLQELSTQGDVIKKARVTLSAARGSLEELQRQYDTLKATQAVELDPATIMALQIQIDALELEIGNLKSQIVSGEADLSFGEQKFAEGKAAYTAAENELNAAEAELNAGEAALWNLYYEIERATPALNEGQEHYDQLSNEASTALREARAELDISWNRLDMLDEPAWIIQTRDDFPGYSSFNSDKNRIASLSLILPWFFFLVATIVCLTTMTRMVEEHRMQIGSLKACGYRRGQIAAIYQSYAWMIGLSGGTLGVICGILIFPPGVWGAYSTMYYMGDFQTAIAPVPCLVGVLGGAIIISVATAIACRNTLNKPAAELMRPRPPRSGRRIVLERIPWLWKRISFSHKVTIRNLLRYKTRFVVTVIGVMGCTALLLAALGLRDSISGTVDMHYGVVSHARATIVLDKPSDSTENTALNDILADLSYAYVHAENITVSFEDRANDDILTYLVVPENPNNLDSFITFRQQDNRTPIAFPPNETNEPAVIITAQLAASLDIKTGDRITFGMLSQPQAEARVSGITENYIYNYLYLTPTAYETLFGTIPTHGSIYLASDLPDDQFEDLLVELIATDNVATILSAAQLRAIVDQAIANLNSVVSLMIASATILAIIVLYNLISITITERERELATMKVLGYHRKEVAAFIFRETTVMTIVGIGLGLLVGIWLHRYVMGSIEVNDIMFSRTILLTSFAFAIGFPLLCNVLVNLFVRPRLNRLDPAKSLKSVE